MRCINDSAQPYKGAKLTVICTDLHWLFLWKNIFASERIGKSVCWSFVVFSKQS